MFLSSPLFRGRRPIWRASSFSDGWGGSKHHQPVSFFSPQKRSTDRKPPRLCWCHAQSHILGKRIVTSKRWGGVGWHASLSEKMRLRNLKPLGWRFSRSCFTFFVEMSFWCCWIPLHEMTPRIKQHLYNAPIVSEVYFHLGFLPNLMDSLKATSKFQLRHRSFASTF